jgi:signal transduction histidine kinase
MMKKSGRFDREMQLSEVFSANELDRIERVLSLALNCDVEIVGPETARNSGFGRIEILWELEPVAFIDSRKATADQLKGCSEIFLLLFKEAVRYRMASELHIETVSADFEALQEKHKELQKSEKQYRELSKSLEKKVTSQVKAVEEAQRKVFQSEKLASVGQLAAGVAHELNTPLAYIRNNLSAAKDYVQDLESFFSTVINGNDLETIRNSWIKEDIDYIREDFPVLLDSCLDGVARLASIISDLKIFSNLNQQQQSLDDINARLITVLKMLKSQIGEEIEIVQDFADMPAIQCYPAQLGQVFYNLIQNGVQAIKGPGKVVIRTFERNGHICVAIADTGTGIQEEDMPRIFDPFFTTKEVGKGTGLGLSVIHDIIKAHHGRIEVQSNPGKGSIFTVFLPIETEGITEDE